MTEADSQREGPHTHPEAENSSESHPIHPQELHRAGPPSQHIPRGVGDILPTRQPSNTTYTPDP